MGTRESTDGPGAGGADSAEMRRARARLDRLERRAHVAQLLLRGTERANIQQTVGINDRTLDRLTRALAGHPFAFGETAEELILGAYVAGLDRRLLVEALSGLDYDADPATHRWEEILDGVREGWVSADELDHILTIRSAIALAAREGWPTPLHTTREMRRALDEDDTAWMQHIIATTRARLREMIREAPDLARAWHAWPPMIEDKSDALLGTAVEQEFTSAGLDAPAWAAPAR